MAETTPVDFDPFAAPKAVEFDPFAAPKSAEPAKPRLGSSILKNLFNPSKFEEEERKTKGEAATGVLSGSAQTLLGVPQFAAKAIPGETGDAVEQYLAERQQALKEQGPEAAQEVGKFVPYLFGGEALGLLGRIPGAARVGEYLYPETLAKGVQQVGGAISDYLAPGSATVRAAPAAAEAVTAAQAAEKLSTTEQILKGLKEGLLFTGKEVAKGAAGGAILGGATGFIAPRAEASKEERSEAMWNDVVDGLELGGEFGAGFGIGGAGIKGAKAFWKSATLSDQKKLIEEAEKVLKEKKAKVSDLAEEAIEREKARMKSATDIKTQTEAALSPTERKIEELAQASREAERRELYESTTAEARKAAEKTGMTRRQAESYVAEQQVILDEANAAADRLAADFAARPNAMTKDELGAAVQEAATLTETKLDDLVKTKSGYADMAKKYAGGEPVFPIESIITTIDEQVKKGLAGTDAEFFLTNLKNRLQTTAKRLGSETSISFQQMDEARKEMSDAITKGIIQKSGGARISAGADLEKFTPIQKAIRNSMIAGDKEFEKVLENYARLKTPLEPYGEKGVFGGVTEKLYGNSYAMLEGKVLDQLLSRTRAGGEGLAELVSDNRQLQDKLRQYLNYELFGGGKELSATVRKFEQFKRAHGNVIDRAGLTAEFSDLATARKTVERQIAEAKKGLEEAKKVAASTTEKLGLEEKRRAFETGELEETAKPLRRTADAAAKEILEAKSEKDKFDTLQSLVRTTPQEEMSSQLRSFLTSIRERNPDALPKEQFEGLLESLVDAGTAYKDSKDALKFAQDLRTYLVTKGLTTAGLSIGSGYGLYRLGRRGE